jgi:hypothetical protein
MPSLGSGVWVDDRDVRQRLQLTRFDIHHRGVVQRSGFPLADFEETQRIAARPECAIEQPVHLDHDLR